MGTAAKLDLTEKNILVTGGNGFLGTHIVKTLQARGVPPERITVARSSEHDLRVLEHCKKVVEGQQIVIHAAAVTGGVDFHTAHPGKIFYDNASMNIHMMEAARIGGVEKFVSIGSSSEYPQSAPTPCREEDLWNGLPDTIHIPYGLAKRMLVAQGDAYAREYGLCAVHLMPVSMYGPGEKPDSGYVIPSLLRKIKEAKTAGRTYIEVWGTGNAAREFLYVEDAAEAVVLATESYNGSAPVNIGSGVEVSIRHVAELACLLMDFSGDIRWDTSKPEGVVRRLVDVSKAKEEFSFEAHTPFDVGFKNMIRWYNAQI